MENVHTFSQTGKLLEKYISQIIEKIIEQWNDFEFTYNQEWNIFFENLNLTLRLFWKIENIWILKKHGRMNKLHDEFERKTNFENELDNGNS